MEPIEEIKRFPDKVILALGFFTRVPLPARLFSGTSTSLGDAAIAFPVVGLIIGAIVATIYLSAAQFVPPLAASAIAITAGVLLTGALHEDGLADWTDAFGASSDPKRILEIMRDSRIGTYGTLAIVASFMLRVALIAGLASDLAAFAFLIVHSSARTAILPAIRFADYARPSGVADTVREGVPLPAFVGAICICTLFAILFGGFAGIIAAFVGFISAIAILLIMVRRIGGYTGDGLGAMEQVAEIVVLTILVGFWS